MRFAMTAKTLAALPEEQRINEITAKNVQKVTRFRQDGVESLRNMVKKMRLSNAQEYDGEIPEKRKVYPQMRFVRELHYPDPNKK